MSSYLLYDAQDQVRHSGTAADGATVVEFWRWAFGNLCDDTLKGLYVEWLVGRLLGLDLPLGGRNGGTNSDLILDDGIRIEIKSTAYWQSWKLYNETGRALPPEEIEQRHFERLEKPLKFRLRRTRDAVDRSGTEARLWSDLYVFAAHYEKDPRAMDLLDMRQWRFYCLRRDEVERLPATLTEDRLAVVSPALTARGLADRADELINELRGGPSRDRREPVQADSCAPEPKGGVAPLSEAFAYARDRHETQRRKGTSIPYISHLMQVAGLVMEAGGDREQTIAALLHDAVEDAPAGEADLVREEIGKGFGERVLAIVEGCTDADEQPKPKWRERKERYLAHLPEASPDVLLVSAADKLHNARAILTDLKEHGAAVWDRFRGGRDGSLWYYRALVNAYRRAGANARLVGELDIVVSEIERMATGGSPWRDDGHVWRTEGLSDDKRAEAEKENLASLRRKVTYCLNRPEERVQFQRVEGWSTGRILGYMEGLGLGRARIERDLPA